MCVCMFVYVYVCVCILECVCVCVTSCRHRLTDSSSDTGNLPAEALGKLDECVVDSEGDVEEGADGVGNTY